MHPEPSYAEYWPGGQEVQWLAPDPLYVLSGQGSQDPPGSPLNVPGEHGIHSRAPVSEYWPDGHEMQLP